MVEPAVGPCLLQRQQITHLFHHAQKRAIAASVEAHIALLVLRQIEACLAGMQFLLDGADRRGESNRLVARHAQHMVGQPLGALSANAGEFGEAIDQRGDHAAGFGHWLSPMIIRYRLRPMARRCLGCSRRQRRRLPAFLQPPRRRVRLVAAPGPAPPSAPPHQRA